MPPVKIFAPCLKAHAFDSHYGVMSSKACLESNKKEALDGINYGTIALDNTYVNVKNDMGCWS